MGYAPSKDKRLNNIAPCSLLCFTCPAYKDGVICKNAVKLYHYFSGYYEFMLENIPKEYSFVPEEFMLFYKKLEKYTHPNCDGCRNNSTPCCSVKGCQIPACAKEHKVNFCFECTEFPCDKVNSSVYSEIFIARWLRGNLRIKEVGAAVFFQEESGISHYTEYIENADKEEKKNG